MRLRIGRIEYANCTPLFLQLEDLLTQDAVEVVRGVPAELNARLAEGLIDVCISSSIEYIRNPGRYAILPDNCIGSDGAVKSVLLFSHRPVDQLVNEEILVTAESATSVILLRILLIKFWQVHGCRLTPTAVPWQEAVRHGKALLLIGDSALKAADSGLDGYCYDLGEAWKQLTGLPFVYALWLVNRSSVKGKELFLKQFEELLGKARDNLFSAADQLAAQAAEASWIQQDQLADYWRHAITYRLDAAHVAGLQQFYRLAVELGLVEENHELEFLAL